MWDSTFEIMNRLSNLDFFQNKEYNNSQIA